MSEGRRNLIPSGDRALLWALVGIVLALLLNVTVANAPGCYIETKPNAAEESKDAPHGNSIAYGIGRFIYAPFCAFGTALYEHREVINAASTVVIGLLTAILAWSTVKLWQTTNRLASDAERQHVISERAFVFLKEIHQSGVINKAGELSSRRIIAKWENSGATPTVNLIIQINFVVGPDAIPADFDYPDAPKDSWFPMFIGPKAFALGPYVDFSVKTLKSVNAKETRVFIWGWAEYNDIFPGTKRHRTEFCEELGVLDNFMATGPNTPLNFYVWRQHNGADAQCFRPLKTK